MSDFSVEKLRGTFGENATLSGGSSLPAEVRFMSSAMRVVERRIARDEASADPAALGVFLLHPSELPSPLGEESVHVPFLDQAKEQLTNRIWFTNEGINSARYVPIETALEAELIARLTDAGLGGIVAVVVDAREDDGELRFYPSGLDNLNDVRVLPIGRPVVTWPEVELELNRLVDVTLATPQRQVNGVSTWKKASAGHAASNAEAVIQAIIRTALYIKYPSCRIEKEGVVDDGRFDLAISYLHPTSRDRSLIGIIELKVLRHKNSAGNLVATAVNTSAVADGYVQIASYAETEQPTWAALCCFDLRSEANASNACLLPIAAQANSDGIDLGYWRLHWSSAAFRRARAAA